MNELLFAENEEENDMSYFKMLIPVGDVPIGESVTKVKGEKPYKVQKELIIYNEQGARQTVPANQGCVFLVDENGSGKCSAVSDNLEVVWYVSAYDLGELLEGSHQ